MNVRDGGKYLGRSQLVLARHTNAYIETRMQSGLRPCEEDLPYADHCGGQGVWEHCGCCELLLHEPGRVHVQGPSAFLPILLSADQGAMLHTAVHMSLPLATQAASSHEQLQGALRQLIPLSLLLSSLVRHKMQRTMQKRGGWLPAAQVHREHQEKFERGMPAQIAAIFQLSQVSIRRLHCTTG